MYFIFDDVFNFYLFYIVKKDTRSCGSPIRVKRVEEWEKMDVTIASLFFVFFPVSGGKE